MGGWGGEGGTNLSVLGERSAREYYVCTLSWLLGEETVGEGVRCGWSSSTAAAAAATAAKTAAAATKQNDRGAGRTNATRAHLVPVGVEAVLEGHDVGVVLFCQHAHHLELPVLEPLVLQHLLYRHHLRVTTPTRSCHGRSGVQQQVGTFVPVRYSMENITPRAGDNTNKGNPPVHTAWNAL